MRDPFDIPVDELRARRSAKWGLTGVGELPAWVAEMDVRLADPVLAALHRAVSASDTGYAGDTLGFREAFAEFAGRRWAWRPRPGLCTCLPDLHAAGELVLRRLANSDGRVVVTTPCYPEFFDWIAAAGLEPVPVPLLGQESGGALDLDAMAGQLRAGARTVLLANPHNPTGRAWPRGDLERLAELAEVCGAVVLSDEVHAPLLLPGGVFTPFLAVSDAARRVGVALHSASKAFNLAGLKAALVVREAMGPDPGLVDADLAWSVGILGLVAGEAAFRDGEPWLDAVVAELAERHARLAHRLTGQASDIGFAVPDAGYLAWLDLRAVLPGVDDPAELVRQRTGLAMANGPRFGDAGRGWARLNLAMPWPLVDEAIDRLVSALG